MSAVTALLRCTSLEFDSNRNSIESTLYVFRPLSFKYCLSCEVWGQVYARDSNAQRYSYLVLVSFIIPLRYKSRLWTMLCYFIISRQQIATPAVTLKRNFASRCTAAHAGGIIEAELSNRLTVIGADLSYSKYYNTEKHGL